MKLWLSNYLSNLLKNDFSQAIAILISGTLISHIAVIMATPILTRLYDPDQFGIYGVYTSILLTISILTSLHYETAIPLPKMEAEAFSIVIISLIILIGSIFVLFMIIHFYKYELAALFQHEDLASYLYLLPLGALGLGFFQIFQLWALRNDSFKTIAKSKVQMNYSQILSQIGLGLYTATTGYLVVGDVIGRLAGGFRMVMGAKRDVSLYLKIINWKLIKKTAVKYKHFPLYSSWSTVFDSISMHIPVIFIASFIDLRIGGLYLIASRMLALPDALIGYSVKQVYFSKAAKLLHHSFADFRSLFFKTLKKLVLVSFLFFFIIAIVSPFAFPIIFGSAWRDAGTFVPAMCILYFFQLISGPISVNMYILELLHLELTAEALRLLTILTGMGFAFFYLTSPWQIILCISLSGAIGFLIVGLFSWYSIIAYSRKQSCIHQSKMSDNLASK